MMEEREEINEQTKICPACKSVISQNATRCRFCQADLRSWVNRHPIFSLLTLGLVYVIVSLIGSANKHSSQGGLEGTPTITPTPELTSENKQALAQIYCEKHQETLSLPDFTPEGFPPLHTKDYYSRTYENGSPLTQEDCLATIEILSKINDGKTIEDIANAKIWIGMRPAQAALSVGLPTKINDSVNQFGVHEQWVYGNSYLYFDGKDKDNRELTTWQNW